MIRNPGHPVASPPSLSRSLSLSLAFLALLVLGPSAVALHGQRITASVDRTEVPLDSPIRLSLTVTGAEGVQPQLPELPDFDVTSAGRLNQIQMINGRTTTSVQYDYLLAPRRTGTLTIPPATVEVEGQRLQSQPITVRVVEAGTEAGESRDVFVSATVSNREPYVGQQVIYTWRFFTRLRIAEPRLDLPSFEGFLMEDLGDVREYEATIEGQRFRVSEFRKALFPQEEGTLTVPGTTLRVQVAVANRDRRRRGGIFEDFFGRTVTEPRVLRTEPIEMNVRPLPAPPPGFTGLVGDFRLEARLSKRELQVGETATLTYTISGTGNAQMISEPELPELPQLKIYDDKPTSDLNRLDSGLSGSKSYAKALVPLAPGELTLPPVSLTYFEVESGSYRTTRTPELTLRVHPAEGEEELRLTESMAPNAGKVAVRILADDILPVHRALDAVDPGLPGIGHGGRVAFFTALATPPLLFLGLVVARRRRERYATDVGWRRRRGALARARGTLSELDQAPEPRSAAHVASRALRGYIGDRLNLEGGALTPAEAGRHLRDRGAEEGVAGRVERVLTRLEAVQYGATGGATGDLRLEIEGLLNELEEKLP